ncbi:MAG: hypothetical protein H0Z31_14505 [Bacillus sp. (in: Bacteria)]|nr:hypothetical protein [Bacillus sp. (in: firmicutes)]
MVTLFPVDFKIWLSLFMFSKLFTRRRLQREQEPKQAPGIERSEGSGLPVESVRHKRNV